MRSILLILCFCFGLTSLSAQNKYFEKILGEGFVISSSQVLAQKQGYILWANRLSTPESPNWDKVIAILNKDGNTLSENTYSTQGKNKFHIEVIPTSNGYVDVGTMDYNQAVNEFWGYFEMSDAQGVPYYFYEFPENEKAYLTDVVQLPNEHFLIGGFVVDTTDADALWKAYTAEMAADGTFIQDSIYDGFSFNSSIQNILPSKSGGVYLAMSVESFSNSESGDLYIQHVNTDGVVDNLWNYDIENLDYPRELLEEDNGDLIICYNRNQNGGSIMRADQEQNIIWNQQLFLTSNNHDIYKVGDGNYILIGHVVVPGYGRQGYILKVDSSTGEVMWTRYFGGEDHDYFYDSIMEADGSLVLVGRNQSVVETGSRIYLVKTNCIGLLTEPEAEFETTQYELEIAFHNLSQFVYPDSIDGGHFIWDFGDGNFSSEVHPVHCYDEPGDYTVSLMAVVCQDTSVYTQAINVGGELCTYVGGIPILQNQPYATIVPNPNSGAFRLSYQLEEAATFTIYQLTGQLVYQAELDPESNSLSIAQGTLPKGVYFYRVGTEESGKLIIQ